LTTNVAHILGSQIPASVLRPDAAHELAQWGGPRIVRGKRVLDLGCGDGRLALGAAPYAREVVGLDPDAELIKTATAKAAQQGLKNTRFVVGAGQELPFEDGAFDLVILSWAL
jgi:ubiquinone/menaquinone biosynthesis C-methylase UbiE